MKIVHHNTILHIRQGQCKDLEIPEVILLLKGPKNGMKQNSVNNRLRYMIKKWNVGNNGKKLV